MTIMPKLILILALAFTTIWVAMGDVVLNVMGVHITYHTVYFSFYLTLTYGFALAMMLTSKWLIQKQKLIVSPRCTFSQFILICLLSFAGSWPITQLWESGAHIAGSIFMALLVIPAKMLILLDFGKSLIAIIRIDNITS